MKRAAVASLLLAAANWQGFAGRVIDAPSLPALAKAIEHAEPGDRIVLADGVHVSSETLKIRCAGTAADPIVVESRTVGGAAIQGAAGFNFEEPAAYVIVRGFEFAHAAGTMNLPAGVHHCRITRNVFQLAIPKGRKAPYLTIAGDDNEIDHNTFRHKDTEGQMLYVQGPGASGMARRTWIHHNYFHDFKPTANNCSALHIGHSARSLSPAHSLVEHNLFVRCRGENEGAICNKSCDNTYRYNTISDASTELSLRHGNRCLVYANFFLGSGGLRFFGDEHRIFSNYFESCNPAIAIGNGGANVPPAPLTSHDRPDGVQVVHNTLVGNRANVRMSRRNGGLGADGLVFANNLIVGGNRAVSIDGPLPNAKWEGNVVWGNDGGPGDLPERGFVTIDPGLESAASGVRRLQSGRRLPDAARGYPYVAWDIDGQPAPAKMVAGADQSSDRPPSNRPLTTSDVGPSAPEAPRS